MLEGLSRVKERESGLSSGTCGYRRALQCNYTLEVSLDPSVLNGTECDQDRSEDELLRWTDLEWNDLECADRE